MTCHLLQMGISQILQHFWNRWKIEYLLELRESHRSCERYGSTYVVQRGDVVTIYDEGHPRGMWRLGKVEHIVTGVDGVVRGVCMKVMSNKRPSAGLCNTFTLLRFAVIWLTPPRTPIQMSPTPIANPENDLFAMLPIKLVLGSSNVRTDNLLLCDTAGIVIPICSR